MSKTKNLTLENNLYDKVEEPKTECVCDEYNPDYQVCYKSNLLNKVFDSTEELKEAEEEFKKQNEEKLKISEQKKARAEEIKTLKQKTFDVRREARKMINDADNAYYKARAEFIRDYGSYHESYYSDGKNEVVTINDLIDSLIHYEPWF